MYSANNSQGVFHVKQILMWSVTFYLEFAYAIDYEESVDYLMSISIV